MRILSLISMLITMASAPLLAMEDSITETNEKCVSRAFTAYVSNNQHISLEDLLHDMQLKEFSNEGVTFTCVTRDIYKKNLELNSSYPRVQPTEKPEILEVSHYVKVKCLTDDGICPGIFMLDFIYKTNNIEDSSIKTSVEERIDSIVNKNINLENYSPPENKIAQIISEPQILQPTIDTLFPNKKQVVEMKSYLLKMGYDGENFNFHTFAEWYGKIFMGYKKGRKIGFNKIDQPIVFNLPHMESFGPHLPICKGFRVQLPCYYLSNPEIDAPILLKKIYEKLSITGIRLENDEDRKELIIKDGLVCNKNNEIQTFDPTVYGVDKNGNIYINGKNSMHHDEALNGEWGLCSGYMSVVDGKINFLSNNSGHYRPQGYHLYVLTKSLLNKNVFNNNSIIEHHTEIPCNTIIQKMPLEEFLSRDENELRFQWVELLQKRINEKENEFFQHIISEINK
jgi:hypothetical protein